jgi:hypothetical protein
MACETDARLILQRLTVTVKDEFVRDLKDAIREVKGSDAGTGNMVALYGAYSLM